MPHLQINPTYVYVYLVVLSELMRSKLSAYSDEQEQTRARVAVALCSGTVQWHCVVALCSDTV